MIFFWQTRVSDVLNKDLKAEINYHHGESVRSHFSKMMDIFAVQPLRTEFPVFWEFLGILKNSQLCKLTLI